jgi:type IX secretion system PorP/SprF family membrane protein
MNKFFLIVTIVFVGLRASAQQYPGYSQFMYGEMAVNPGSAGSYNNFVCLTALVRQQWVGFNDGAPSVSFFNAHANFSLFGAEHGAGISITNEEIGFNQNLGFNLTYAFIAEVADGHLGIGVNGGMMNDVLNPEEWIYPDESGTDLAVPGKSEQSKTAFDMSFGLFYRKDDMFMGLSSTHINQGRFAYMDDQNKEMKKELQPYLVRHYYVLGGYKLNISSTLDIQPSFLIESDGFANQFELNGSIIYNKKMWAGVSYRVGSAIIGMLGLELFKDVQVGYAYDFTTSALRKYGAGSHELMIRYAFEIDKVEIPERYRTIRFLY